MTVYIAFAVLCMPETIDWFGGARTGSMLSVTFMKVKAYRVTKSVGRT